MGTPIITQHQSSRNLITVRLRDYHNAIVKIAVLSKKQLKIVEQIDLKVGTEADSQHLYDKLGVIGYTEECPIGSDCPLYDGYYDH